MSVGLAPASRALALLILAVVGMLASVPPAMAHPGHGTADIQAQAFEFAKSFSGKMEPFLAVGLRMGDYAMQKLGAQRYGLKVVVQLKLEAPQSLLLDGLQIATGATLGNRDLKWKAGDETQVTFTSADNAKSITLALAPTFDANLQQWLKDWQDPEIVALYIYNVHPIEDIVRELP